MSTALPDTAAEAVTPAEELLWRRFSAVLATLPPLLDERLKAATGLNYFQFSLLETLSHQPGGRLQLSVIAQDSGVSLSRLSHAITKLENQGLLERAMCDHDRRATWATLTPAGSRIVEEARGAYVEAMREVLLDRVAPEHHAGLTALLTSLLPGDMPAQCTELDGDLGGAAR